MHDINRALLQRKTNASFTSKKLDLMNAVAFDKRLDPYSCRVFHAIIWHLNAGNGKCFPADDLIAQLIGGSARNVRRARFRLRECGYLDWRQTGRSNFYSFNYAAAVPMLIANRHHRIKRIERRERLQRELEEARGDKPLQNGPF